MKVAPVADVKTHLSAYLEHAELNGPVVITRNGKAVAVLIAPSDENDLEHLVLSRSPQFLDMLARSQKSIAAGKGIPAKEFWAAAKRRGRRPAAPKRKPRLGLR